jgi:hypothetical protein
MRVAWIVVVIEVDLAILGIYFGTIMNGGSAQQILVIFF